MESVFLSWLLINGKPKLQLTEQEKDDIYLKKKKKHTSARAKRQRKTESRPPGAFW